MSNIVKYTANDGQEISLTFDTVKKYLISGRSEFVTDQELVYFMGRCKSGGMNPFIKDAYLIKYKQDDPAAIVTSIDFYRRRARAQPDCKGWKCGPLVLKQDGELRYSNGIVLPDEQLIGGWFYCMPEGFKEPIELEVNLEGYLKKTKDGRLTQFWKPEKQAQMITKIAESQGLRRAWPGEFQKLYTEEEIQEPLDVTPISVAPEATAAAEGLKAKLRQPITSPPEPGAKEALNTPPLTKPNGAPGSPPPDSNAPQSTLKQRQEITELCDQLTIKRTDALRQFMAFHDISGGAYLNSLNCEQADLFIDELKGKLNEQHPFFEEEPENTDELSKEEDEDLKAALYKAISEKTYNLRINTLAECRKRFGCDLRDLTMAQLHEWNEDLTKQQLAMDEAQENEQAKQEIEIEALTNMRADIDETDSELMDDIFGLGLDSSRVLRFFINRNITRDTMTTAIKEIREAIASNKLKLLLERYGF